MVVVIWIALSILVGSYASSKGRSGILLFFISLFLSPLLGFIIAYIMKRDICGIIRNGDKQQCSYCKELIDSSATVCKFCNKSLIETQKSESNHNSIDRLIELKKMLDDELISREEFERLKSEL